ncbi:CPBP family intramembrane glutamic endopeptidase [Microbacterium sp. NPDC057659]|uniref:CPBP family intramembrane glutamic endopeptidase n=1 Tax=Microbacterium sp. NPDC057659 TaxID=3346198 RepID=UPI00366E96E8
MTAQDPAAGEPDAPVRIAPGPIIAYVLLACGLAWLLALPLWLGDGLAAPFAGLLLPVIMYTPAAAVVIVMLVMRPVPRGQRLRFLGMWPLRPASRVIWMSVISLFGTVAVVVLAMLIAIAFGWMTPDFVNLSGFAETVQAGLPAGVALPSPWILVAAQMASLPIAAATINALAAFGEELGWRGFLVPALRRYGTWTALLVSGAIWGLWHAPIILLGYDFGRTDILGVLLMVGGCIAVGVLFGWTRLRTGSMWPAVFAHGALNAAAGLPIVFRAAGAPFDPALSIVLGVSGWIACAIVVVVLLLTGQFRKQPALAAAKA